MKNSPNSLLLGTLALITAGILGGIPAYLSKIILRELPPLTVLFVRITIMLAVLLPLARPAFPDIKKYWKQISILSLFWVGNLILFIVGIQYATAIASGLIYAGSPLVVILEERLFFRTSIRPHQLLGIILGFIGVAVLIISSSTNISGFGSFTGVILLFLAKVIFSSYLVFSKPMSKKVSPIGLTTGMAIFGWFVSLVSMLVFEGTDGISRLSMTSVPALAALIFYGVASGGAAMYFLIQWGIKRASPLAASSMIYISTFVTAFTGVAFLGEALTAPAILSGISILFGVYLITILPILKARKIQPSLIQEQEVGSTHE